MARAPAARLCGLGFGPVTLSNNDPPHPTYTSTLDTCEWLTNDRRACLEPTGPDGPDDPCRTVTVPWDWVCAPASQQAGRTLAWYDDPRDNRSRMLIFPYSQDLCDRRVVVPRRAGVNVAGYSSLFINVVVPIAAIIVTVWLVAMVMEQIRVRTRLHTRLVPATELSHMSVQPRAAGLHEDGSVDPRNLRFEMIDSGRRPGEEATPESDLANAFFRAFQTRQGPILLHSDFDREYSSEAVIPHSRDQTSGRDPVLEQGDIDEWSDE